jgi:hypothetical protein
MKAMGKGMPTDGATPHQVMTDHMAMMQMMTDQMPPPAASN